MSMNPRVSSPAAAKLLYLHGFASGPESSKGRALEAHFRERHRLPLTRLDLRLPSLQHLRFSAMMREVRTQIGGEADRAVLFGSSLGGLTAARVAEADPRVFAVVLLAPAFRLAENWRPRLGEAAWAEWQRTDVYAIDDHATGTRTTVDFGFVDELSRLDAGGDGWPDVRVPTLILHGVHDDVVDIGLSRTYARGRRHARLVELDDGHQLSASTPRITAEVDVFLAAFLNTED